MAEQAGRKFIQGPSNPFLAGNEGSQAAGLHNLPGLTNRRRLMPAASAQTVARGGSRPSTVSSPYDEQIENYSIIAGTPKSVLPGIRHVLEYLRPGNIMFWDGDGAQTRDDATRSLRLIGQEVLPAVREMGKELGLNGAYEVSPDTGERLSANPLGDPTKSSVAVELAIGSGSSR